MKVKNSLNAKDFDKNYRIFSQPSMTIPDQTMSIKTILERYARGLPVGGRFDEYYDEEDDLPNPLTLDLAERQELEELYKFELNEINNKSRKKQSTIVDNSVDNSTENKTDETES
jgi:hypothetical protein